MTEEDQGFLNKLLSRLYAVLLYIFHGFHSRGGEWQQGRAYIFSHPCIISITLLSSMASDYHAAAPRLHASC